MKKILTFAAAASVLISTVAFGGLTQPAPIEIDEDNQFASGDQWTARSSKNDDEFIGCGVTQFDNGAGSVFSFGFCQAGNADGSTITCLTESPDLLATMRATSAFAYISFSWNEDGECTRVRYSTQSFYLPNFTNKN